MSLSGTSGDMMWQVLVLVSIWTLTGVNARTLSEDQAETLHNLHKRKYMYIYIEFNMFLKVMSYFNMLNSKDSNTVIL